MKRRHMAKRWALAGSHDDDKHNHAFMILKKLSRMKKDRKGCDITIKAEGEEIPVHRNVMMAGSDYFDAMFSHDTKESRTGIVEMKDMTILIMTKCVNFIYTGKISVTEEECEPLLYASSMLQLSAVREKVASFLKGNLAVNSFFRIEKMANKFGLQNLSKDCDRFALENLDKLVKVEGFGKLDLEYVSFLVTAKEPSINEDYKLEAVLKWIKTDILSRREHMVELMKLLDLEKVSVEYGRCLAVNESLFYESAECMKLLFLAVTKEATKLDPASSSNSLLVFNQVSRHLEAYRPANGLWSRVRRLPDQMAGGFYTAVVHEEDCLYVLMTTKDVYVINLSERHSKWVQRESMVLGHGQHMRAAAHLEFIYAIGADSMERYCTVEDEWEEIETAGIPCNGCVVEYKDRIYTIGGSAGGVPIQDVNKLSPSSLSWSVVQPMLGLRENPSATVYNDKIYVAGGAGSSLEAEYYDIQSYIWTRIPSMSSIRHFCSMCVVNNKIFVVGKMGIHAEPSSAEAYDPEKAMWTNVFEIPDRRIMSCATIAYYLP